jgi:O-acetyl-ADP-ribose deacetylase
VESPVRPRVRVVRGDITKLAVDAIVNAANETLLGGGGVDGAIHRAAGPGLLAECRSLGSCPTGEARITGGYSLLARHVIHTVGPVFWDGTRGEAELLRSCYRNSLRLAAERGLETMAFPCISTGVYGYPKAEACDVAVAAVTDWLAGNDLPREVTFCCFGEDDCELYAATLGRIG